jgi:hypothetical protein
VEVGIGLRGPLLANIEANEIRSKAAVSIEQVFFSNILIGLNRPAQHQQLQKGSEFVTFSN